MKREERKERVIKRNKARAGVKIGEGKAGQERSRASEKNKNEGLK